MATPERIIQTEYSDEMQKSYIDYAMSVIVSRALPDIRDGLKPVQRRTLYDMYELSIRSDKPYRKSARIVGDTMGKFHPHGDSSIYESLVVMSQDFKKSVPLIDGHGNFGSIEGDTAAAMRYTEARLFPITEDAFLEDLDKDVVDFVPNFDETEKEPSVLPVKIPNLLINGAEGIAVGMATSIPPHNVGEVIDGLIAYMKNPEINTYEMMKIIKGPDFPTGGIVANKDELLNIYSTGEGKIRIRGKVAYEKGKNGRQNLVVTEIPYTMIGLNIGKFLNDVYSLVENRVTSDITDISNQSAKEGIRIVIELKKGADATNIENLLYKKTRLEDTFSVNMLSVVDNRPETLGLIPILRKTSDFQFELCKRKYEYLLQKERGKKEIQEGLIKACNVIDLIIEIIRGSKDRKMVKECLVNGVVDGIKFKKEESKKDARILLFTEKQADAILDMRLYKLIGLEIDALRKEYLKTLRNIQNFNEILSDRGVMAKTIIDELLELKKKYTKERKTKICNLDEPEVIEEAIKEEYVYVLFDRFFYAKVIDTATFERNKETLGNEFKYIIKCKNTDTITLFTNKGNMHLVKAADIPIGKLRDKGKPIDNISNFDSEKEDILHIDTIEGLRDKKLLFGTKNNFIKIVSGSLFDVTKKTTASTKLIDDELLIVSIIEDNDSIVICSDKNYFLRFMASDVPEQKKQAKGVRGMNVGKNEKILSYYILKEDEVKVIKVGKESIHLERMHIASRSNRGTKK